MKNITKLTPEMMKWLCGYHGLSIPSLTAGMASGLLLAEGSISIKKGNGPGTIDCPFSISQNHRQAQLLARMRVY
jgi:hypothetical protein